MAKTVADALWEMLVSAGVTRCYGIVGDALNPTIDALRRNGSVDFVHVRNEEYGTFAAVAEASLTGRPVAVCGTAGPGTTHLINGLLDARKERAPVIAIAGDVESSLIDSDALGGAQPLHVLRGRLPVHRQARQPGPAAPGGGQRHHHGHRRARTDGDLGARRCRLGRRTSRRPPRGLARHDHRSGLGRRCAQPWPP